VLVPLAEAGFEIDGIDSSRAMLAIAAEKVAAAEVTGRARLLRGDFAEPGAATGPERGRYGFAFALMNTFLHLPDREAQLAALEAWHDALAPGGLLLIDIFAPDVAELASLNGRIEWDQTWTEESTGRQVMKLLARTVDPAAQRMQVSHIYDEVDADGTVRRSVAAFELRYLWRFEAELVLEKAGFEVEAVYGDWDMTPYDSASDRMIFVARAARR
jgi:SAM-dependent methyltransferase